MIKRFKIFTFVLFFFIQAYSQPRLFVSPYIGYGRSAIQNKNEKNVPQHISKIKYQSNINYGVEYGLRLREGMGIQSLFTGIGVQQYGQEYFFERDPKNANVPIPINHNEKLYALFKVKYITVPLGVTFNLANHPRFRPILSPSIYVSYLTSSYDSVVLNRKDINQVDYWKVVDNRNLKVVNQLTPLGPMNVSDRLDNSITKQFNFGLNIKAGLETVISDKISIAIQFQYLYGITNTDNTENIKGKNVFTSPANYWEGVYARYYSSSNHKRPPSHNQWIGGTLSLHYAFKGGLLSNATNYTN